MKNFMLLMAYLFIPTYSVVIIAFILEKIYERSKSRRRRRKKYAKKYYNNTIEKVG